MRLGLVPENLVERLALLSGLLAPGVLECWIGIMLARTVIWSGAGGSIARSTSAPGSRSAFTRR